MWHAVSPQLIKASSYRLKPGSLGVTVRKIRLQIVGWCELKELSMPDGPLFIIQPTQSCGVTLVLA